MLMIAACTETSTTSTTSTTLDQVTTSSRDVAASSTTEPERHVGTVDSPLPDFTIPEGHGAQWSRIVDLPISLSSGSLVVPVDAGIVVLETDATTLVGYDGLATPGDEPPVAVSPDCCGSAVGIPVGSQMILFDSYGPGTWVLDPGSVTWSQAGDRPSTGDVLGSARIEDQLYVVTASPRDGTMNAQVAALDTTTWEWTEIEPVPAVVAVGGVTSDGESLIVAGVNQDGNNIIVGESRHPVAYGYLDGEWSRLPDLPIDGQAATVVWVEEVGLLALNYDLESALHHLEGNWDSMGTVPMPFSECLPQTMQVDSGVVVLCGGLAHFESSSQSWSPISMRFDSKYVAADNAVYELAPENGGTTLSVHTLPPP